MNLLTALHEIVRILDARHTNDSHGGDTCVSTSEPRTWGAGRGAAHRAEFVSRSSFVSLDADTEAKERPKALRDGEEIAFVTGNTGEWIRADKDSVIDWGGDR